MSRAAFKMPMRLAKVRKPESRMNGLEAEFEKLFLLQRPHGFEEITLRIGPDCRYTPDFWVLCDDDVIEFREVKGHWRDDAKVKIRVAAERFPMFRFAAFSKLPKSQGGGWKLERFGQLDQLPDEPA